MAIFWKPPSKNPRSQPKCRGTIRQFELARVPKFLQVGPPLTLHFTSSSCWTWLGCTRMHMAIATFFHVNNLPDQNDLPDQATKFSSFKIMIKYARMVITSYKPPDRQEIGGTLLDSNHKNIVENNKKVFFQVCRHFCLILLSDAASIPCMPLINILGLCADNNPNLCGSWRLVWSQVPGLEESQC